VTLSENSLVNHRGQLAVKVFGSFVKTSCHEDDDEERRVRNATVGIEARVSH
jgi:hypothetical protein